ncbi:MAG: hypothetical protein R3B93_12365 [Bacteroidia bacterium]
MKPSKIIILIALAIFVVSFGVKFSTQASAFTDFQSAKASGEEVHVVGSWINRDVGGYDHNTGIFTFMMQDTLNHQETVIYKEPKPMNLEHAEKIVIVGAYEGGSSSLIKSLPNALLNTEPNDITAKETE